MEWWCLSSPCYLVVPGAALVPRSPPTIEELLWTIRDAWPPPRSLSLDSEKRDRPKVPVGVMGTGSKPKDQAAPRMGLPYRRYSVPETVMRKYTLSRAQTSASDVGTVPTPSVPSIGTSSGATKRMCHKACQTSPPDSAKRAGSSHSASDGGNALTIPTVNIIPSTNISTKLEEDILFKYSSNSNEFSPSEEISDYNICGSRVYKSEVSLPGAIGDSPRFLTVPELVLDPHDSPHVSTEDDNEIDVSVNNCTLGSSPIIETDRDKCTEIDDTVDDEILSSLLEQSETQLRKLSFKTRSNSVPESSNSTTKTHQRSGSANEKELNSMPVNTEELNIEQFNFEQSLSPEGTPTPAPTCHTYDSQGNMLSECYITDCDMCNAEGRRCCSLDDSGSQSCSFTSPEMVSSNELKSSTDFTTSSMTLDQTVSDRTTSTQDSTISLTSITPESAETKEKSSTINISPILVIDSEATLVEIVSPRNKSKNRELFHPSESSQSKTYKSDSQPVRSGHVSDSFPAVISCESAKIPETQNVIDEANDQQFESNAVVNMVSPKDIFGEKYSELNNNKITISKEVSTQHSVQKIDITPDTVKNSPAHYLYLTESESSATKNSTEEDDKSTHKIVGNYTTSHLYLTETGSSTTQNSKDDKDSEILKQTTGNYTTDYLYITESESSAAEASKLLQNNVGNGATNYMYLTESESSGTDKTSEQKDKEDTDIGRKCVGDFNTNYLYMTESDSSGTNKTSDQKDKEDSDINKTIAGDCRTNYLYMTESDSSGTNKTSDQKDKEDSDINKTISGDCRTNYLYMTESDSSGTNKTSDQKDKENTDINKKIVGDFDTNYLYMTESGSSGTNETSDQKDKEDSDINRKIVGNYNTNCLYMTESDSSGTNKTLDQKDKEDTDINKKIVGDFTTNYLYLTESESTGTNNAEDTSVRKNNVGNYANDYLYVTESESSGHKTSNGEGINPRQRNIGISATDYLYMTESESSEAKPTSNVQDDENIDSSKKVVGNYGKNYLYMTESKSSRTSKSSTGEGKEGASRKGAKKCATNYLYMTESESSATSSGQIKNQNAVGKCSTNYLYLTESDSAVTQHSTEDQTETKIPVKTSRNYSTNYMYLTEDESGFNPDSLEVDRRNLNQEFDMDSLAMNDSKEGSDLLENLGFCENLSKIKYQSNVENADQLKNKTGDARKHEQFYGNTKYEILLKDSALNKASFMGNVMPIMEEKEAPLQKNVSSSKRISTPEIKTDSHNPVIDGSEVLVDDDPSCKMIDRETTMGSVAGGTYWELPGKELVIPRFSALPRTLSMIVNTSSMDCSSDSDLSLADSLEDSKSDDKNKGLKPYNKYDNRLVRGDIIALLPEEGEAPKKTSKEAKAYFLSLTGEEGDIKVEQIPEEIKQKLMNRYKEVKKHSDHSSGHGKKCKGKGCAKKVKKHHRHHCCSSVTDASPKSNYKTLQLDASEKMSKFTQWEDLGSSKDSSDTLVPSDFSEKDKDAIFQGDYKLKDVCTSPYKCQCIDNDEQNDLNCWLETVNSNCGRDAIEEKEVKCKDFSTSTNETDCKQSIQSKNISLKRLENKWVQCENMPYVDSAVDEEISHLLIENLKSDCETQEPIEERKFKCVEHQVPWSKDMCIQVSQDDLLVQDIVDIEVQSNLIRESKFVQTADEKFKRHEEDSAIINKTQIDEPNKIELNLTGSPRDQSNKHEYEAKSLQDTDDDERCKTPVPGERPNSKNDKTQKQQEKSVFSKPTPKFNVKSTPSRRSGNLGSRFKQKFEVIPEEKSGSLESSNDERKSPIPVRGRRASMPSEMLLKDIGHSQNKSSDSSTSSNDKKDNEDCDNFCTVQTAQVEGGDYHRRHTIHGNLTSRNTKTEAINADKNEQSRRHTIHGSLALSKNDSMLKQLNLLGGTLLKGRVFGKQSGVMFGRFRPINEETQVQKDERSLVEEHLERLRRDTSKGREALAVARAEEQDELLTLSQGWINFYLLGDSQDLGSDGSNGEEGSKDCSRSEDKSKRTSPSMKTVTVVGKPEEDLRHQFTVQINASPEPCSESGKLPDIGDQHMKSFKTPSLSPDLTLPDITPTSSPVSTPPLPDTPISLKPELPQIQLKGGSRSKKSVNEKFKPSSKKPQEKTEKKEKVHIDNDQNLRYLKLSSMKQELQTEKTYFARSGEIACSELSQSSSSSVTADSPTLPSIKWPSRQLQRRSHSRHLHARGHPPPTTHPNPQACWTVTLAGSSGNPTQPPPDVEMRLSFSNQQRGPATSQSDSGLGEDGPSERGNKHHLHPHHALPPPVKHQPPDASQWKVLLKTHQETEKTDQTKTDKRASLPEFNYTPGTARLKKKRGGQEDSSRPVSVQVQEILEHNISLHKSSLTEEEWVEGLSVTGQAITPERKPRVPTMSERDLTRQWYHHRSRIFH